MANINGAFGLRQYTKLGSRHNNQGVNRYAIQTPATAGLSAGLFEGQPVIPLATGVIGATADAAGGTVPWLGVFRGCEYVDLSGKPVFTNRWPGTAAVKSGTVAYASVVDDPDQLFLINCNAAASLIDVFRNANMATAVTGSTASGISAGVLDVSTLAATNTLNLRIVGFEETPNNADVSVAGRLAIVFITNHFYRYSANGTGLGI